MSWQNLCYNISDYKPNISASGVPDARHDKMMAQKTYRKTLCLFYILTLLLWGVCSGASSVSEITETVCGVQDCYVNRSSSASIQAARHLPSQEYLSVRASGTSETLSAARSRSVRPLSRSVRQAAAYLFSGIPYTNHHALSGLFSVHEIPSHNLCGIIITNYIHRQDGQRS